jgi:hypothetical protein
MYKNVQVFNVPYLTASTEPSFTTGTRGTAIIPTDHQISQDVLTISNYRYAANYIDRADLAQFDIFQATEAGKLQGSIIDEGIEAAMLANHTAWTDFGDTGGGVFGLAATQITVSSTNIDDIVRAVEEQVVVANGKDVMKEKGLFVIWRAADRTKLAAFAQANGFQLADYALKNGIPDAYFFLNCYHYVSNSHTANHLFAGVRGLYTIGLLTTTYGRLNIEDNPLSKDGINISTRADYGLLTPTKSKPVLFDLNVV